MSADLERRYARVLRLYPAAYRRERGAELMATLLESAADGGRTSVREYSALVLGALRAHAGQERRDVRSSVLTAFRVAALMLLVSTIASAPVRLALELASGAPATFGLIEQDLPDLAAAPLGVLAVLAVLHGYHRSAALVAALAFAVESAVSWSGDDPLRGASYVLVIGLLLPLFRSAPRPASGLVRYLPLVAFVYLVAWQLASRVYPQDGTEYVAIQIAFWGGALLWACVDERVTLAVGLLVLVELPLRAVLVTIFILRYGAPAAPSVIAFQLGIAALVPAVLLATSAVAVRRRLRP